ncbi:MAG: energy transducer TonB [Candidatus Omnitrophica bacterium]|nr:energy transducer TonB [Candidatus Omnitrophota bacterium]
MFSNKAFNIAFILSLAWHLLCISLVNIVVLPGRYTARDLTSVSFLGPILEKTALEIMLVNKPVAVSTSYHHDLKYSHHIDSERDSNVNGTALGFGLEPPKVDDKLDNIEGALLQSAKEIPRIHIKPSRHEDGHAIDGIEGIDKGRELIYKPDKPKLPRWITSGKGFSVVLEFVVTPQGDVSRVVPVISSGDPDVDLLAIRYLKSWKFSPANGRHDQETGTIKMFFAFQE